MTDDTGRRSALLQRLGIALPILQAPMAGVQDHRLAVAVSNAGGLGALPAAMLTLDALEHRKIPVVALVLNETAVLADPVQEEQQKSTVALLRERVSVPLLGPLPYQSCADCAWPDAVDAAADSLPIRELAELVLPRVAGRS